MPLLRLNDDAFERLMVGNFGEHARLADRSVQDMVNMPDAGRAERVVEKLEVVAGKVTVID